MKHSEQNGFSEDPIPSCATCEYARLPVEGVAATAVFCTHTAANVTEDNLCPDYIYDLLKRLPRLRPEMPHLAPGLLDD